VTKDGRPLHSSSCALVLPSLNNRHCFLTFPSFTAPSPHTSTISLWISAGRRCSAFKNRITDRTLQVARFPIFVLIFNEYSKSGVGGGRIMTPSYVIHVFPFTDRIGMTTGRARVICAATTSYFLGAPCTHSGLYLIYIYSGFLLIAVHWENVYISHADYFIKNNTASKNVSSNSPSGPCRQRHNFSVYRHIRENSTVLPCISIHYV
jgi:hypothetical protein